MLYKTYIKKKQWKLSFSNYETQIKYLYDILKGSFPDYQKYTMSQPN